MTFLSAVRAALGALRAHKGRSFLTSLGIVIGVGAVVALVSAGEGVRLKLDDRMASVGENLILVRAGAYTKSGSFTDVEPFTREDVAAVRRQAGGLLTGLAEVQVALRPAATPTKAWPTLLCGTSPDMAVVRGWRPAAGRFFTAEELDRAAAVCVVGETVRRELFAGDPAPVGRTLRVGPLPLRVVGVLAPKGRNPAGADQDDEVFVPLTTLQRKVAGEERVGVLLAAARSEAETDRAVDEIGRTLRRTHRRPAGAEDFDVSSVREMAELGYTAAAAAQALVAAVAALSLVVGGVGIMNIMLVSVTERTREIGLRMAVGARAADVLGQFLAEAVVLAVAGGLVGAALGAGAAAGLARAAGWPVVVPPWAVLLAVGVSAGVGLFFGLYPAWKASRLDPIVALRHES
jgi:putative ABC transport system permease protein